jgi:hypothetical protein
MMLVKPCYSVVCVCVCTYVCKELVAEEDRFGSNK